MGIKGLLKELRPLDQSCHVSEFAGQYVGVDALCWLHRGSYGCAMDLVLGKPTNKHIEFCKNMLNMLIANNLKPILVFDGPDKPKMKNSTAESRRESRRKNKSEAMKYLGEGDMSKAIQMFQRAVHVTDDMINGLMNLLKEMKIPFIRAPHEADAQLAHMYRTGVTAVSITEDSDLIPFGANKIIYKLDKNGNGIKLDLDSLDEFDPPMNDKKSKSENAFVLDFKKLSYTQRIQLCILSGCDYLDSLPGIGLKTAIKLLLKYRTPEQLFKFHFAKKGNRPDDVDEYIRLFKDAQRTFIHQLVYDPNLNSVVRLNPIEGETNEELKAEVLHLTDSPYMWDGSDSSVEKSSYENKTEKPRIIYVESDPDFQTPVKDNEFIAPEENDFSSEVTKDSPANIASPANMPGYRIEALDEDFAEIENISSDFNYDPEPTSQQTQIRENAVSRQSPLVNFLESSLNPKPICVTPAHPTKASGMKLSEKLLSRSKDKPSWSMNSPIFSQDSSAKRYNLLSPPENFVKSQMLSSRTNVSEGLASITPRQNLNYEKSVEEDVDLTSDIQSIYSSDNEQIQSNIVESRLALQKFEAKFPSSSLSTTRTMTPLKENINLKRANSSKPLTNSSISKSSLSQSKKKKLTPPKGQSTLFGYFSKQQ